MKKSNLSKYWDLISLFKQLSLVLLLVFAIGCTEDDINDPKDPTQENPPVKDDDKDDEKDDDNKDIGTQVQDVSSLIDPLFTECTTISELSTHLNEIKANENISDAKVTNNALFVTTLSGVQLAWLYPPKDGEAPAQYNAVSNDMLLNNTRSSSDNHDYIGGNTSMQVCIINQQANDERCDDNKSSYERLKLRFPEENFNVDSKNGKDVSLDFIATNLSKYNIIFFVTHGAYDDDKNIHWIMSGEEGDPSDKAATKAMYNKYGKENIGLFKIKETRNNKEVSIAYWTFNQNFISNKISKGFDNSIIFCTACQSLKGNYNIADAFKKLGVKAYLGYNETNCVGKKAGPIFFEYMLAGYTIDQAYAKLSNDYKQDKHEGCGGKLVSAIAGAEDICIVHPEVKTIQIQNDDLDGTSVVIKGVVEDINPLLEMTPGFCWSTTNSKPTIDSCDDYKNLKKVSGIKKDEYDFECEIDDIEPNTTYYYRAYIHFNDEVWYGDVKTFEIDYDPEAYMRAYLIKLYNDTDGDNWTVNKNWCSNEPLNTWAGVSKDEDGLYSISLSIATRSNNLNGAINLSGCKCLKYLYLYHSPYASEKGKITSIDVSDCTALTDLSCQGNSITYINAHNCSNLDYLDCSYNNLIQLDLGNCENLVWLNCSDNFLESLNVDQFPRLETLYCEHNHITAQISKHMHQIEWLLYDKKYKYYGYGDNWEYEENEYGWYYPGEPSERGHNAPEAWH